MSSPMRSINTNVPVESAEPLAVRIARAAVSTTLSSLPHEVIAKTKLCLFDLIGCAFESRALPWSRQALGLAQAAAEGQGAAVIGSRQFAAYGDAAFANAVMGHGLVREDMHSGSISHLGIVVLPTLLALAQYRRVSGRDFIAAAVVGYEVGGQVGRAVMDAEIAKIHRPTGVTGPVAAAAAGARLLALDEDATTSAIALGANTTLGFNQWAHTGGSEMFFQAGFAARNALTSVRLAELGAFASPSALDGVAGLFAALKKRSAASAVELFRGEPEMLSVYHKPVPACNFAQTPCQAALRLAADEQVSVDRISSIKVRVPRAGALYPGCDYAGPFAHILQAKMSIQYNVAAALMLGSVSEKNFTLLNDSSLHRLIAMTSLEVDDEMTRAYPSLQGGEVEVTQINGMSRRIRLDNVVNATAEDVRRRSMVSATDAVGAKRASEIERFVDALDQAEDVGALGKLLLAPSE
jgi:2-methylcitrate dehydratase PrpD